LIGEEDDSGTLDATGSQLSCSGLTFAPLILRVGEGADTHIGTHGWDLLPENGIDALRRIGRILAQNLADAPPRVASLAH